MRSNPKQDKISTARDTWSVDTPARQDSSRLADDTTALSCLLMALGREAALTASPPPPLVHKVEHPTDLAIRLYADALIEDRQDLAGRELPQRHVVLDAPHQNMPVEGICCRFQALTERLEMVCHQGFLGEEILKMGIPAELHLRICHRARMPEQQHDRDAGKACLDPAEDELYSDILDHSPAHDRETIELVDPFMPDPARQNGPRRFQELGPCVIVPELLTVAPVRDGSDLLLVEGLEHDAEPVAVVDHFFHPRRAAAAGSRQEDGAPPIAKV